MLDALNALLKILTNTESDKPKKIKNKQSRKTMCGFNYEDYEMILEHAEKELEHHKIQQRQCIESISSYSERLTKINSEVKRCERMVEVAKDQIED